MMGSDSMKCFGACKASSIGLVRSVGDWQCGKKGVNVVKVLRKGVNNGRLIS